MHKWTVIGITKKGYTIYRVPNKDIGGFDYISESLGYGFTIVDSCVSLEELEIVLKDLKAQRKELKL